MHCKSVSRILPSSCINKFNEIQKSKVPEKLQQRSMTAKKKKIKQCFLKKPLQCFIYKHLSSVLKYLQIMANDVQKLMEKSE